MKTVNKEFEGKVVSIEYPETPIEAVNQLESFLISELHDPSNPNKEADAKVISTLKAHFNICKRQILEIERDKDL